MLYYGNPGKKETLASSQARGLALESERSFYETNEETDTPTGDGISD